MKFIFINFTEEMAKEICNWEYDDEYSIYNYPKWDKVSNEMWGIAIEDIRKKEFTAIVDDFNYLSGYIRLHNKNEYILIGMGLKPSLCGQGLGNTLLEMVKQKCDNLYPSKKIVLEVRSFNDRAIKCYKKAGFVIEDTYEKDTPFGPAEFIRMELNL